MAATRRLNKELSDLRSSEQRLFREIRVDESNILHWKGLLCPDQSPYDSGAFKIEINMPEEYPFKPPEIKFLTWIYHPNIDTQGKICLPIISPENWKPYTRIQQIISHLAEMLSDPDPNRGVLRDDLAHEYLTDRKMFKNNAIAYTTKYAEIRPATRLWEATNAAPPAQAQRSGAVVACVGAAAMLVFGVFFARRCPRREQTAFFNYAKLLMQGEEAVSDHEPRREASGQGGSEQSHEVDAELALSPE